MTNEDPLMDDEQAGEAVARYLEENPELLEGIVPEHDLWPAIESRIAARIIPMSAPPARPARRASRWIPMLVAASALIAGSAGITYVLTTRSAGSPASNSVASNASAARASGPATTTGTARSDQSGVQALPSQSTGGAISHNTPTPNGKSAITARSRAGARLASHDNGYAIDEMRETYDVEITSLHETLDSRRAQLNPATVAIVEQNLHVIDEAIRQSKAALARDPNSRLLNDQLDRTLAKKTSLLRAAVLLPAA